MTTRITQVRNRECLNDFQASHSFEPGSKMKNERGNSLDRESRISQKHTSQQKLLFFTKTEDEKNPQVDVDEVMMNKDC